MEEKTVSSLAGKLSTILGLIDQLTMQGKHGQGWMYHRESDVVAFLRKKLSEQKIFVFHSTEHHDYDKETGIVTVMVNSTLVCGDTDQRMVLQSIGWAACQTKEKKVLDTGIYKATTGAIKYFWLKNFMLSDGGDPENDSYGTESKKETNQQSKKESPKPANEPAPANHDPKIIDPEELKARLNKGVETMLVQNDSNGLALSLGEQLAVQKAIEGLNGGFIDGRHIFTEFIFGKPSTSDFCVAEAEVIKTWAKRSNAYEEYMRVLRHVAENQPATNGEKFIEGLETKLGAEKLPPKKFAPVTNGKKAYGTLNNPGNR